MKGLWSNHLFLSKLFKIIPYITLCLFSGGICAQNSIKAIDLSKIKHRKVKNYILEQQKQNIEYFSDLEASVHQNDDLTGFLISEKSYVIQQKKEIVWKNYRHSCQTDVWDIKRVSFSVLYSRDSQSIVYADQDFFGLAEGQIYYLNLKVLNGFYNLPVAFEVINVDTENNFFEFSYLKGGKAQGKQTIQFVDTEEGYTEVIHKSFVKSNSKIRDKYIYPFFHNKIINEFHNNMRKLIMEKHKYAADMIVVAN